LTTFSNSTKQPDTTSHNQKSGSKVAAVKKTTTRPKPRERWSGRWSNLGSDHLKRWEKRLYIPKSGGVELCKLAVRIQHLGQRQEFRFDTNNRQAAATKALEIFRFLKANGWAETQTKHKPECEVKHDTTIGSYLTAVQNLNILRLRTFLGYRNALRNIAAGVFTLKPDKGTSKYDYRSKTGPCGRDLWVGKIDAHRLDELTADKINAWKRGRIARAGSSPIAVATAHRTINSFIRNARSLFAPAILRELKGFDLPPALPFAGVDLEDGGSSKYVSKINAPQLIADARAELKDTHPEVYKAFLLGLFAGLRKAEMDLLEWRMIDFAANLIQLRETEWLHLKTQDSADDITVDPEMLAELKAYQPASPRYLDNRPQFVLVSDRPPRPEAPRPVYRSKATFDALIEWLRSKGITANKPLHELRKELGALVATKHGIYAASRFLRHSDITTTARHYAAHKDRISAGLGKYLKPPLEKAPTK
jgi:integrase